MHASGSGASGRSHERNGLMTAMPIGCEVIRRGDQRYEQARKATCRNRHVPDRYPEVIVQATTEHEVAAAVRLAAANGWKVGIRSGGHSWSCNHVRAGGMLLDVSRLNQVTIDKTTMLATAGPGCRSDEFDDLLAEQDLFFPVGHCQGVGPGFFGVVTRFHLRLHRRPPVIGARLGIYPVDMFEELLRWTHRVGPTVPNSVELMFVVSRRLPNTGQPGILLIVAVFADTEEQALDDLSFLETRPEAAHQFTPFGQIALQKLTTETMSNYPLDHYHVVDNMWTHASADELLPGLNRVLEALPEPPAHFIWMNWSPKLARSDMAYSLEDETYIALYGLWEDPAQETTVTNWVLDGITDLSPLSSGIQLADENLARRSGPFMAAANRDRLEAIRRERDPAGRFHTYGDVPEVG